MFKQSIKEALVLVLAALVLSVTVYAIRSDKIDPIAATPNDSAADPSSAVETGREITIEEARHLFNAKGVLFADARHRADFEAGHIQGAVHLSVAEPDAWLSDFLSATDPLAPIVAYCDGNDCQLARDLAELLFLNGFENARYLKNGWTRWRERGFPVESSR